MRPKTLSLSVVIPNWNGAYLLEKHLQAVIDVTSGTEIIVVDDKSTDNSVVLLKEKFPQVRVILKQRHEGFASTVNVGVEAAHGEIVLLLNTDVEPTKGFLISLLPHFRDPQVFAVGCLEKSFEADVTVLRGRGEAHWQKGFFVHWRGEVNQTDTAWVSGGSGAFRRSLWLKLGGMDTVFNPFYWEDIDLSYRALKAGYKLVFEPKSLIEHYHEEGKIKREFSPQEVKKIAYRNQFIFIWKNLSDNKLILKHICWTPLRFIRAAVTGDFFLIQGYFAAVLCLPVVILSRRKNSRTWIKSDRDIFP